MEYRCRVCEKETAELKKSDGWEMLHLHFSDKTIDVLACDECKKLSPLDILEKVQGEI